MGLVCQSQTQVWDCTEATVVKRGESYVSDISLQRELALSASLRRSLLSTERRLQCSEKLSKHCCRYFCPQVDAVAAKGGAAHSLLEICQADTDQADGECAQ